MAKQKLSIYLSRLLRHQPQEVHLDMDVHGWVDVKQLIVGVNSYSKYTLDIQTLEEIVVSDSKGRYRFNEDHSRIKACQGHSLEWVVPELSYPEPPDLLYHGSTKSAWEKIQKCGYISRMKRHAVHMSADFTMASKSATRWRHQEPLVIVIDAKRMKEEGCKIGKTENDVWCVEKVDIQYIKEGILL